MLLSQQVNCAHID